MTSELKRVFSPIQVGPVAVKNRLMITAHWHKLVEGDPHGYHLWSVYGERLALICEGDLVCWHGRAEVTHTGGEFMGGKSSGRRLSWEAMDLFRVADGKIVERWGLHDQLGRMQQMGTLPAEMEPYLIHRR